MLRDTKEEESVEESLVGREETIAIVVGPEGDRGPSSPIEMEILDGMGHLGLEESLDDDMNFYIRRLIMEDDASKGINNLPPWSLGSVSPNLPLVLYHNPDKFLPNLIKNIKVHSVHANYKASDSSHGTSLQGSLQPGLWRFVLLSESA